METPIKQLTIWQRLARQEFFHSGIAQWLFIFSLFVLVVDWVVLPFFIRPVDFPIVLHYNVYFGVDLIGAWWEVYALPLVATMVLLLNTYLAAWFYARKERAVAHLLGITALIVQIGIAIAEVGIIRINY